MNNKYSYYICANCSQLPNAVGSFCGMNCFREFYLDHFDGVEDKLVEIRRTSNQGLGIFTKADVTIYPNTFVGPYVGEILPQWAGRVSRYNFNLSEQEDVVIDSRHFGNWTRFVNSHCQPNLEALSFQIGKMMFILYRAIKVIRPGEELFIKYGRTYFRGSGFRCTCDARDKPHWPPRDSEYVGKEIDLREWVRK